MSDEIARLLRENGLLPDTTAVRQKLERDLRVPRARGDRAILLIPDDPAALSTGPCGMRPPMMIRGPTRDPGVLSEWVPFLPEHWGDPENYASTRCTLALVLAFDGVVLPAGCLFALPIEKEGSRAFLTLIGLVRALLAGSTVQAAVPGWTLEVLGA